MKLLIIGGHGMAGHLIVRYFRSRSSFQVVYTSRQSGVSRAEGFEPFVEGRRFLDASHYEAVEALVLDEQPDVIVNAVGMLNQEAENHPLMAYRINGFLPHWLAHLADRCQARLIHISSDCVFSGAKGSYTEADTPDGTTVYARTKALGELRTGPHLTIRTSIIGPEIRSNGIGLMQWFLSQKGEIKGYERVLWNGVTTLELAKAMEYAIENPHIGGLVQLTAPETINKYELLLLMQEHLGHDEVTIVTDSDIVIDRSLSPIREDWQFEVKRYAEMLTELAQWMSDI
ncbi:dTDP-4-dehydrorhamnose reductase family protein [Paenibacillus sp. GCM10012307]|uniref:dTDP-4-dehydrorhamnose reductase n=1 Tax=Paenibacillus roseus TaxID=2798579 RepID=A0A934J5T5_9BACL|nr:SDR family oxidoreductase [Paenibacillus roseus]MBJ6363809.1 SDR family oxidoreductase [Paenibacillus roseus]